MSWLDRAFPAGVGAEIRHDRGPGARRRRTIAGLAALAAADFLIGALYQTGLVRRLPDLPIRHVDSRAVMGSRAAYPFGIPDTLLALLVEVVQLGVATTGGSRRPRWLDTALRVTTLAGAAGAAGYGLEMIRQRRICAYCTVAIGALVAQLPLAFRVTAPLDAAGARRARPARAVRR